MSRPSRFGTSVIVVCIVIAVVIIAHTLSALARCESVGGELVRGVYDWKCIR